MQAIIYKGPNKFQLIDIDMPKIQEENEVIVKVELVGICGTDLNIYRGKFPAKTDIILGHEAVGTIVEKGKYVTELSIGQRVLVDPTMWCGNCSFCRQGDFNLCNNKKNHEVGVDYHGAFAEYIKMPRNFIYSLPDELQWEKAVLVEPLACVLNNFEAGNINYIDDILILGCGPIGAIAGIFAQKIANKVLVLDVSEYRVNYLKEMGINAKMYPATEEQELLSYVKKELGVRSNVVIDTTGNLYTEAIQLVEKGGRVILMGFNSSYMIKVPALRIVNDAIKIIGAGDYNLHIESALKIMPTLPIEKLVSHVYRLDRYIDAINMLLGGSTASISAMKVLLKP